MKYILLIKNWSNAELRKKCKIESIDAKGTDAGDGSGDNGGGSGNTTGGNQEGTSGGNTKPGTGGTDDGKTDKGDTGAGGSGSDGDNTDVVIQSKPPQGATLLSYHIITKTKFTSIINKIH